MLLQSHCYVLLHTVDHTVDTWDPMQMQHSDMIKDVNMECKRQDAWIAHHLLEYIRSKPEGKHKMKKSKLCQGRIVSVLNQLHLWRGKL